MALELVLPKSRECSSELDFKARNIKLCLNQWYRSKTRRIVFVPLGSSLHLGKDGR